MGRTLKGVIEELDAMRPGNPYSDAMKIGWINSLEGRVQTDVFLLSINEITQYRQDGDQEAELQIPPPYDDLYGLYLQAWVDFSDGEYGKYQNTMTMFNSFWTEFVCWFANTYDPASRGRLTELGIVEHTAESGKATALYRLAPSSLLLRVLCVVEISFDSGTELILGVDGKDDGLMAAGDIDETMAGTYYKPVILWSGAGTDITATLTKGGPTEGKAVFYGHILTPRQEAEKWR